MTRRGYLTTRQAAEARRQIEDAILADGPLGWSCALAEGIAKMSRRPEVREAWRRRVAEGRDGRPTTEVTVTLGGVRRPDGGDDAAAAAARQKR